MNEDPLNIGHSSLNNSSTQWLSMSEAALLTPYSAEYLSLLARKGRLTAKKVDNVWYTTKPIVEAYLREQNMRAKVSQSKIETYAGSQKIEPIETPRRARGTIPRLALALFAASVLTIALLAVRDVSTGRGEYVGAASALLSDTKANIDEIFSFWNKLFTNFGESSDSPPTFDQESFKNDLLNGIKDLMGEKSESSSPLVTYHTTTLQPLIAERVIETIYRDFHTQTDRNTDLIPRAIDSLAESLEESFDTLSISASSTNFTSLLFTSATGTSATTTNLFSTTGSFNTLNLTQLSNGSNILRASRITDTIPTGDFISYKNAAGDTDLFRVDNSGNIFAGGITNSGALTITSVSSPQFRVQYDASNEFTTAVSATGATTLGLNGSTPRLTLTPQSNRIDTFKFTDSFSNEVFRIDTANNLVTFTNSTSTNATTTNATTTNLYFSSSLTGPNSFTINSSGNVGIGASEPGYALDVNFGNNAIRVGANSDTYTALRLRNSSAESVIGRESSGGGSLATGSLSNSTLINTGGAYPFQIFTNHTARMIVDSSGNVGIGTTTPQAKLSVSGSVSTKILVDAPTAADALLTISKAGVDKWHLYQPANSTSLRIYDNQTVGDIVTFASGGNVGIGTTTPAQLLHVYTSAATQARFERDGGTAATQGTTDFLISDFDDSTGDSLIQSGANRDIALRSNAGLGGVFRIKTGGDTVITGGNVGIGDTTPDASLDIEFSDSGTTQASFGGIFINNTNTTANNGMALTFGSGASFTRIGGIVEDRTSSSEDTHMFFGTIGGGSYSEKMRITSTGNVGIGTTTPDTPLGVLVNTSGNGIRVINRDNPSTEYLTIQAGGVQKGFIGTGAVPLLINNSSGNVALQTSSGNVGIGTAYASTSLHVMGPSAVTSRGAVNVESGDDASNIFKGAIVTRHRNDTTVISGSSIGIAFQPLASTGSIYFGAAAVKGVRENDTVNNQDTSIGFYTRSGSSNTVTDTEKVRITSTGNVGIGTTAPARNLTIHGGASGVSTRVLIQNDNSGSTIGDGFDLFLTTTGGTGVWNYENGAMQFGTNNTERMRIDASGNVGIGTTTPTMPLSISGSISGSGNITRGAINIGYNVAATPTLTPFHVMNYGGTNIPEVMFRIESNAQHEFSLQGRSGVGNALKTIQSWDLNTGNVGIGNTSPGNTLQIGQSTAANNTDYSLSVLRHGSAASPGTYTSAAPAIQITDWSADGPGTLDTLGLLEIAAGRIADADTNAANALLFRVANDTGTAFAINGKRNVGIGTTGPNARLQVHGGNTYISNATDPTLIMSETESATAGTYGGIYWDDSTDTVRLFTQTGGDVLSVTESNAVNVTGTLDITNASGGLISRITDTNGGAGVVTLRSIVSSTATRTHLQFSNDGTGSAAVGSISTNGSATAYNTSSDVRLKEGIVDTELGLEELMQMRVRDYIFISDPEHRIQTGFIAQELYEIFPDAVSVPPTSDGIWMVDYGRITPILTKSIQELNTKIEAIEFDLANASTSLTVSTTTPGFFAAVYEALGATLVDGVVNFARLAVGYLTVGEAKAERLCLGETCVTETELIQLLQNSGSQPASSAPAPDSTSSPQAESTASSTPATEPEPTASSTDSTSSPQAEPVVEEQPVVEESPVTESEPTEEPVTVE